MRAILIVAALALAGCETQPTAQEVFESRMRYCASLGFTPGTPEAGNCVLQLHAMEEQRRAAIGAAIIGSGMLSPQRPTSCYTVGGYTRCQ